MRAPGDYHFERLTENHEVADFRSGNVGIDLFLQREALTETLEDRSRTFVLVDAGNLDPSEQVIGFFTLKAEAIWTTGLPLYEPPVYVPVTELAYLARRMDRRGEGWGDVLLLEALRTAHRASQWIGISGVSLYATTEGARLYDRFGFLSVEGVPKYRFLPMAKIRAVAEWLL
jgi:hypothetical protein